MSSALLSSYRSARESLGELEKAVETIACGSCSHSISRSPKCTLLFLKLRAIDIYVFLFLEYSCTAIIKGWFPIRSLVLVAVFIHESNPGADPENTPCMRVDAGPTRAVGRGPWAVGRGPLGRRPVFSKTQEKRGGAAPSATPLNPPTQSVT